MVSREKTEENAEDEAEFSEEVSWDCWLRTVLAGCGALIQFVFVGINESQSSVLLPQLRADTTIHITEDQESWVASLVLLMAPISALISGPALDIFGRKKGLLFFYFITCLGYGLISSASNVYQIYAGRIILGIGSGLNAFAAVYLAEISTKKQRRYLSALITALVSGGETIVTIVGGYLPWYRASLVFSLSAFVLLISQCFIPESPPWLFKQGKEEKTIRNFRALRRTESAIQLEIKTLKLSCAEDEKFELRMFLAPNVWKPFLILVTVALFQSACGAYDLIYYTVDFIERLGTTYDPVSVTVWLFGIKFVAAATIAVVFYAKTGRKVSLACSGFGMALAFAVAGGYVCVERGVSEPSFQWLPILALFLYIVANVIAMASLCFVMCGELYPLRVRCTLTGWTEVINCIFMFIFVKTYYVCIKALGFQGLLFVFAGFSLLGGLFGIFVLPETQNKSLFEIEQGFLPEEKRQSKGVPLSTVRYGSIASDAN